jgi:ribose 5-phosphate isomerase RpiB
LFCMLSIVAVLIYDLTTNRSMPGIIRNSTGVTARTFPSVSIAIRSSGANVSTPTFALLGARVTGVVLALEIVRAFVAARFTGEERHQRRLSKVAAIEKVS